MKGRKKIFFLLFFFDEVNIDTPYSDLFTKPEEIKIQEKKKKKTSTSLLVMLKKGKKKKQIFNSAVPIGHLIFKFIFFLNYFL